MTKNNYLLGILAGLMVLNLTACDKPTEKIQERTSDNKIVEEKAPFETTANEIAKAYADNVVTADNKFKDITFNVTGTVAEVSKNLIKEPYVRLKGGVNTDKEPQFVLQQSEKDKAAELKVGQNIKLQCIGQGNLAEIPMAGECKFLD
jgi:hypothetical protein